MRGSSACRPPRTPAKTSKSLSGTSARQAGLTGALLGVATFAVYMVGSNRSFGYDAAATFANFIATPSLWDAFAVRSVIPTIPVTQVATNDHVLLSLISHLIYTASGSRSEVVYRLVPALAAGATVGLTTGILVRRFGLLAGLCAGLFVATALLGVWVERRRPWLWAIAAVVAAVVLILWLGLQPAFLYPRFFIFLVPAIAYLMAAAVA